MSASWPKSWAEKGDSHTTVSKNVRKAIGHNMEAVINSQGGKRRKPFVNFRGEQTTIADTSCSVEYVPIEASAVFRAQMEAWREQGKHVIGGIKEVADPAVLGSWCLEWVAISTHTEGYPSGGSVEYATFAYFDGEKLHTGGQLFTGPQWHQAQFYRIER